MQNSFLLIFVDNFIERIHLEIFVFLLYPFLQSRKSLTFKNRTSYCEKISYLSNSEMPYKLELVLRMTTFI